MNKFIKIAIGAVVVAGLGFAGVKKIKEVRAKEAHLPKAKIYPVVVKTITPKITPVTLTLPYLAEVANDKNVKLASRIASRIEMIKSSSSNVTKGEVVVQLDTTSIKSSLKSIQEQIQATKVALANLESTHKRTLELLKVKGASIEESQKESTMIANTQAKLNALKQKEIELENNLSYAKIVSPVNGVISRTFSSKGAISFPGKPLLAISSKNGFYLMVRVPTNLPIQGVKFENKFYNATPLNTTFHGLAEYKVYIGGTHHLISGDRVQVNVVTFKNKAILLPFNTLLNKNGKSYVLVVHGNQAVAQKVNIIQSAQQGVVVSDDLSNKQIVLAKPDILLKLTSGYALKIKD